jgi:ankyrin repeat protein
MTLKFFAGCMVVVALSTTALARAAETPLADAVQRLDRQAVSELLRHADVNAAQVDGMTALHWAAYHDESDVVDRLVDRGAAVEATNRYGVTPLSIASANGNAAIVRSLLDAGADPNTTLPGGETVLMTAARTGRPAVVRALLAAGADAHRTEARRGQTALMWAAAEGHVDVVEVLLEIGADFRTPLDSGFTPLLFAVREGHLEVTRTFLRAGADVNVVVEAVASRARPLPGGRPIRVGTTPLLLAVTNGHFELAAELLRAGAQPDADVGGHTVLHALARVRKPGGGDNNPAPDGSGTMSSLEFVRELAAYGANLDARMTRRRNLNNTRFNEIGATPFMLAALTGDAMLMNTLAELGADPLRPNAENSTPLMAAAGLGTRSPGEDAGTEDEVLDALEAALALGADLNAIDDNGETAMHGAAYKNLPEVVAYLAASGSKAEVWNQRNRFGWTPLSIARGYRFGNFKPSPVTVAAVENALISQGITPLTAAEEDAISFDIYAPRTPRSTPPRAAAPSSLPSPR